MTLTRYQVIELDANDKPTVLQSGLTQGEARKHLAVLRDKYGQHGLRYVMRREGKGYMTLPNANAIWEGKAW